MLRVDCLVVFLCLIFINIVLRIFDIEVKTNNNNNSVITILSLILNGFVPLLFVYENKVRVPLIFLFGCLFWLVSWLCRTKKSKPSTIGSNAGSLTIEQQQEVPTVDATTDRNDPPSYNELCTDRATYKFYSVG